MERKTLVAIVAAVLAATLGVTMAQAGPVPSSSGSTVHYEPVVQAAHFVSTIDNPYFPLPVGRTLIYHGVKDGVTQVDRVRQKCPSAFIVFGWTEGAENAFLIAALTPDLVKKGLKAGDVVKQVAPIIGGGGGGKPDMAQAGGKEPAKLPEALRHADKLGRELLAK